MNKQISLIVLFTLILFSCSENKNTAQMVNTEFETHHEKIDYLLKTYEEANEFMGSLSLVQNGKTIYEKVIGLSNIESNRKAKIDTRYRIGSITKMYTAVLIFKAIEENKISLDQTIEKYFTNIKNASKITVAHLLQHRSGIHSFTSDKKFFEYRTQYKSPTEMLEIISNYESNFDPNNKGDYSNSNYYLLAQILERIYKSSYDNILQKKICIPLNLKNTYSGNKKNKTESFSYAYNEGWNKYTETDMSIALGTGSIISTVTDVNKFIQALFEGDLISVENLELMKTIKGTYGMGFSRYKINDRLGYGHRGRIDGFKSTSIYFPEEKLSFTLISNASKVDINDVYSEILKLYFDDAVIEISEDEIKKFVGVYVSENSSSEVVFSTNKNVLIHIIKNEFEEPLVYKGENRFLMEQMYAESISFTFSSDGKELTFEQGDYIGKFVKK